MGWWAKSEAPARVTPSAPAQVDIAAQYDAALDTIAAILRTVGLTATEGGEEGETIRNLAERWAMHVLVVEPPPNATSTFRAGVRRWPDVQRFVSDQLRSRSRAYCKASDDLRDVVQAFVRSIGSVVAETDRSDKEVAAQIDRLRRVVEEDSIDRIREEVLLASERLGTAITERQQRQRAQLQDLTGKVHSLRAQLETARRQSELDPLTQVANRAAFDQQVSATVDFWRLTGEPSTLLFVDVDHFKHVNDTLGHQAGDEALRCLANTLVRAFPRNGDFIARYGGEEFCIVLRNTEVGDAHKLGRRLMSAVRQMRITHAGNTFSIQVSIGISSLAAGDTVEEWIARADGALYTAKRNGRNRIEVHGHEIAVEAGLRAVELRSTAATSSTAR